MIDLFANLDKLQREKAEYAVDCILHQMKHYEKNGTVSIGIKQLAEETHLSKQKISKWLKRMEHAGLITRIQMGTNSTHTVSLWQVRGDASLKSTKEANASSVVYDISLSEKERNDTNDRNEVFALLKKHHPVEDHTPRSRRSPNYIRGSNFLKMLREQSSKTNKPPIHPDVMYWQIYQHLDYLDLRERVAELDSIDKRFSWFPSPPPEVRPRCPKCNNLMVLKMSREAHNFGMMFYGCTRAMAKHPTLPVFPEYRSTPYQIDYDRIDKFCRECEESRHEEILRETTLTTNV